MKIIDVEQGSDEWHKSRLGKPTASCFDKIITPTGKESTQSEAYQNRLVAELLVGHAIEEYEGNQWMDRGNELEQSAADFYAFRNEVDLCKIGFALSDDGMYGASPDRLIGEDGILEIKCPAPHTHIKYMLDGKIDNKYYPQLQGQLLVTGRKWADIISYHPELTPIIIRVNRDEKYIHELEKLLKVFCLDLEKKYLSLSNNKLNNKQGE